MSIEGLEGVLAGKTMKQREEYAWGGFNCSYIELHNSIQEMKNAGMKFIPGSGCEHNPDGSCPGHPHN